MKKEMFNYFAFREEQHKNLLRNIVKDLIKGKEVVVDNLSEEDLKFIQKELNKYECSLFQ
jgi:hypothetical protein